MAKQESIEVEGIIKEALPGARFRVTINLGGKDHEVLAHVSGKMRMHFIKMPVSYTHLTLPTILRV